MTQLSVCEKCFAKNPACKINAIIPMYINNFNVHGEHDMLTCGLCGKEIPCQFCGPVAKGRVRCPKCDKCMLKGDYPRHQRMHDDERNFRCARCGKGFVLKHNLVEHLRIHTGEKPYQCEACGRCFSQKQALTTHQRLLHSELRPFICQVCSATYKTHNQLNEHMHSKHKAKYPPCVECGQVFSTRNDLRQHMAIHHHITNIINDVASSGAVPIADGAPYYCSACDEPFINECFKMDHERLNACEEYDDDEAPPKKKQKIDDDDLNDLIAKFAQLKISDDF